MVRDLSPKLVKIAKDELNEDPKRIQDDLQSLKHWISKQPHLKARTDDQWLVAVLRGCKFHLEKAKKKLDLFYTMRSISPEILLRNKPSEAKFLEFLKLGSCLILKPQDEMLPRMIVFRPGVLDYDKHHVYDIICTLYYLIQILMIEDDTATVLGVEVLVDYRGTSADILKQCTPASLMKMIMVYKDSLPIRSKASHHINLPSGIEILMTMIKACLSEKIKARVNIYKKAEELFALRKEIIPAEYGGSGGTFSEIIDYWVKKIIEYQPWFRQEEQFGTDETKRPEKAKTNGELFGVQGSFKKLDID